MNFRNSECRSGRMHHFDIIGESDKGVLERCRICHKKKSFRVVGGSVNNGDYLSYHARNALVKEHRRFGREYPQRPLNRAERRAV